MAPPKKRKSHNEPHFNFHTVGSQTTPPRANLRHLEICVDDTSTKFRTSYLSTIASPEKKTPLKDIAWLDMHGNVAAVGFDQAETAPKRRHLGGVSFRLTSFRLY